LNTDTGAAGSINTGKIMNTNDPAGNETPVGHSGENKLSPPVSGGTVSAHPITTPLSHSRPSRLTGSSSLSRSVNSLRITELRQKIADGSYTLDAARIAESLMNAARDFFIRRH